MNSLSYLIKEKIEGGKLHITHEKYDLLKYLRRNKRNERKY